MAASPTRGRPKQVLCFPVPALLRGRGGHVGRDPANYISHNSVHRRHLGRWAVAALGLALQAARPVLLIPILGLHHGGRGIPQSRASGEVGNSCSLFPLLHTWDPGPRVGPCGEACSSPTGQGPKDPDVRGSHISSPDTHPAHSAHPLPFQTSRFCFSDDRILGFQRKSKSWYPALRTSEFGAGKLIGIEDSQAQTAEEKILP